MDRRTCSSVPEAPTTNLWSVPGLSHRAFGAAAQASSGTPSPSPSWPDPFSLGGVVAVGGRPADLGRDARVPYGAVVAGRCRKLQRRRPAATGDLLRGGGQEAGGNRGEEVRERVRAGGATRLRIVAVAPQRDRADPPRRFVPAGRRELSPPGPQQGAAGGGDSAGRDAGGGRGEEGQPEEDPYAGKPLGHGPEDRPGRSGNGHRQADPGVAGAGRQVGAAGAADGGLQGHGQFGRQRRAAGTRQRGHRLGRDRAAVSRVGGGGSRGAFRGAIAAGRGRAHQLPAADRGPAAGPLPGRPRSRPVGPGRGRIPAAGRRPLGRDAEDYVLLRGHAAAGDRPDDQQVRATGGSASNEGLRRLRHSRLADEGRGSARRLFLLRAFLHGQSHRPVPRQRGRLR